MYPNPNDAKLAVGPFIAEFRGEGKKCFTRIDVKVPDAFTTRVFNTAAYCDREIIGKRWGNVIAVESDGPSENWQLDARISTREMRI